MDEKYLKIEIPLEPDVLKQLEEDIDMDVADRKTHPKVGAAYYQPNRWGDDYYDWLVDLVKQRTEETLGRELVVGPWWLMSYVSNEITLPHSHVNMADWVTIYYFSAPEGSGALYFNTLDETVYPYTGLAVIHKGDEMHEVFKNSREDITRRNLVINFWEPQNVQKYIDFKANNFYAVDNREKIEGDQRYGMAPDPSRSTEVRKKNESL